MSNTTAVAETVVIDPNMYEWMVALLGGIDQVRAGMEHDRVLIERATEFETFTDGTILDRDRDRDRDRFSVTLTAGTWTNDYGKPMRRMGVLLDYASGRAVKRFTR